MSIITQRTRATPARHERPAEPAPWELLRRTVWVWPMVVAALVVRYHAAKPQLWRDEFATWSGATRSSAGLSRLNDHIDAVVAPYYRFMHLWIGLFGDSPLAMRMPSILAAAATAGVVAVLGTMLGSPKVGLLAGLLFAILPSTSRYGQEARPYALASFAAATATLLLLVAVRRQRWFFWAGYAVALALLGSLHLIALLILTGHLIVVLWTGWTSRSWRPVLCAGAAVLVGVAPIVPLALRGHSQVGLQLGNRVPPPDIFSIATVPNGVFGSAAVGGAILALAVVGALTGGWRGATFGLMTLAPLLAFLLASTFQPLFTVRYVIFLAPLACVLAGLALAGVRLAAALTVPLLLGFLCLRDHEVARISHEARGAPQINYRAAAAVVGENRMPGDVIVYDRTGWQFVDIATEYYLRGDTPADVLATSTRDLAGSFWTPQTTDPAAALAGHQRVWAMLPDNLRTHQPGVLPAATTAALQRDYREVGRWPVSGIVVVLYQRQAGG